MPRASLADGTGGGANRGLAAAALVGLAADLPERTGSFLEDAWPEDLTAAFGAGLGDFFETVLVATDFFFDLLAICG